MNIDNQLLEYLSKNGWSPDREISIEQVKLEIEKIGFHVNSHSEDILRSFGNLQFSPVTNDDARFVFPIFFDAYNAAGTDPDDISCSEEIYGKRLTPIALIGDCDGILMCSENGEILCFKRVNLDLAIIGKTIFEALNLMIFNKGNAIILDEV